MCAAGLMGGMEYEEGKYDRVMVSVNHDGFGFDSRSCSGFCIALFTIFSLASRSHPD